MRKFLLLLVTVLLIDAPAMPACAGNGEILGTLFGTGIGALFGSQFGHGAGRGVAALGGAVVGGLVGNRIGTMMDYSGSNSLVVPQRPGYPAPVYAEASYEPNYVAPDAPPPGVTDIYYGTPAPSCRPVAQNVVINGRIRTIYETVCMQPDGTWELVEE